MPLNIVWQRQAKLRVQWPESWGTSWQKIDCPILFFCINMKLTQLFSESYISLKYTQSCCELLESGREAVTASRVSQGPQGGSWASVAASPKKEWVLLSLKEKNCSKSFTEQRGEQGKRKGSSQWRPFLLSLRLRSAWPLWNERQRNVYSTCNYLSFASFLFQKTFSSFQNSTCKPPRFQSTEQRECEESHQRVRVGKP